MKNIILLICLLVSTVISSQELKIGEEHESKLSKEKLVFVGESETSFFLMKHTEHTLYALMLKNIYIEKYNKKSKNLDVYTKLEMPSVNGGQTFYHDFKIVDNQIILFTLTHQNNILKIYAQKLDNDLKFAGSPLEISSIGTPNTALISNMISTTDKPWASKIFLSKNGMSFFVVQLGQKKNEFVFSVDEWDNKLKSIKNVFEPINNYKNEVDIIGFEGISNGSFFILSTKRTNVKDPDYGADKLHDLIFYNSQTQKTQIYPILPEKSIKGVGACFDYNSNIILGAMELSKNNKKQLHFSNCFAMKIFANTNAPVIKNTNIPEELKNSDILSTMSFRSILPDTSGGFFMIYEDILFKAKAGVTIFGNIKIIKMTNEMEFQWHTEIHKQQVPKYGYVWEQVSYNLFFHNNSLYFIFNDHPDNTEDKDETVKRCTFKSTATFLVAISPYQGKVRTTLCNYDGKKDIVMFGGTGIENGNTGKPFLYFGNKEKFKIGELIWND